MVRKVHVEGSVKGVKDALVAGSDRLVGSQAGYVNLENMLTWSVSGRGVVKAPGWVSDMESMRVGRDLEGVWGRLSGHERSMVVSAWALNEGVTN